MNRCLALLLVVFASCSALALISAAGESTAEDANAAKPASLESSDDARLESRIAALEQTLSGATLVGHFTETNAESKERSLSEERYELSSVRHLGDGKWLFQARIKYGDHDLTVPLTLPIQWAGDTPVITVDKLSIIGLGAFDARVMVYRDHYAGFWSGKDHGGHLFGMVQRPISR